MRYSHRKVVKCAFGSGPANGFWCSSFEMGVKKNRPIDAYGKERKIMLLNGTVEIFLVYIIYKIKITTCTKSYIRPNGSSLSSMKTLV